MGIHDLWLFIVAGLLLNITPGPDMALIVARSLRPGSRTGVVVALGVGAGAFVHIAAAAIGVSALILASATAFTILKYAGAAYLIYIGIQMIRGSFRASPATSKSDTDALITARQAFAQGFLTNALNPKVALFFLAFLPQFVDAEAPSKVQDFIVLGLIFDTVGTVWNIGVAMLAGRLATIRGSVRARAWLDRTIGTLFVGVGVKVALTERP